MLRLKLSPISKRSPRRYLQFTLALWSKVWSLYHGINKDKPNNRKIWEKHISEAPFNWYDDFDLNREREENDYKLFENLPVRLANAPHPDTTANNQIIIYVYI